MDEENFRNSIGKMAEDAVASGSCGNTVSPIAKEDCEEIFRKAIGRS